MENFIIAYIAHRMAELGYKKYSFEPIFISVPNADPEYTIQGQNEYYYLVSKIVAEQTEILSDNNYFKAATGNAELPFGNLQEFTGQIKITNPLGITRPLEFIRVIPHS